MSAARRNNSTASGSWSDFSGCKNDCRRYHQTLDKAMKSYIDVTDDMLSYKDDFGIGEFGEHVTSIEEELHKMAKLYKEVEHCKKAISHIEQVLKNKNIDDIMEEDDLPDVKLLYQDKVNECRDEDSGRENVHPKLQAFRDLLLTYNEEQSEEGVDENIAEEGLSVGRIEKSLICPFTQTSFVEPVKNKNCGHTYSKEAVMQYLHRPRSISRCPVIGCSSIIMADVLEKDEEMERAQRRAQRNRQKT